MSGPEYLLNYYAWEKGKAIATIQAVPEGYQGSIQQIIINPFDATEISVVGDGIFKVFRYSEGFLRSIKTSCPIKDYNAHLWLQNNAVALVTADGFIFITLDGNIIQEFDLGENFSINTIVPTNNGFVVAGSQGQIIVFSQLFQDVRKDGFEIKRKIQFPDSDINFHTMAVDPGRGNTLVESDKGQIFKISLEEYEISKKVLFQALIC